MNLELEREFGAKVWHENLKQQDLALDTFKAGNRVLEAEVTEINKKRKFSQVNQTDAFLSLQARLSECRDKNLDLECEIARIELEYLRESSKRTRVN